MSRVPVASTEQLLALAVELVREAGAFVVAGHAGGVGAVTTKSTPTDVVTEMDRAAERLVVRRLREVRPGDGVLGEEGGQRVGRTGVRWLLDPIDGTVNYLYGIPAYAVSLAAEVAGEVVAGAVYNPASGELWTAAKGAGAHLGDPPARRLTGSPTAALSQALLATGFAYDARVRATQAAVVARLLPRVRDIRRFGAASLDLCFAAAGRVDAYFERGLSPWDVAAGGLIAREAGLRVSGLSGAPDGRRMVLAAPPQLYGPLRELLSEVDGP